MDLILRGYPIGFFLLWETYEDIQYRPFVKHYRGEAPHAFRDNSARRRLKVVLDGQQRLQSLYVALYGSHERRNLWFDLLSGQDSDDLSDQRFLLDFMSAKEVKEINGSREYDESLPYLYVKTADLFSMSFRDRREYQRPFCEVEAQG